MAKKSSIDLGLTDGEKKILISIAMETIQAKLNHDPLPHHDYDNKIFSEKRGAFVTLHIEGKLRGCIGYIIGVEPLLDTIQKMAISSAFNDPRFPALRQDEFEHLNVEISVLSPLEIVNDIDKIQVGRDGLIIKKGFRQGLLLPQVPEEQDWDKTTFLQHTCLKAGLPPDAWKKKGTTIKKFSAQIFDADVRGNL